MAVFDKMNPDSDFLDSVNPFIQSVLEYESGFANLANPVLMWIR